MSSFGVLPVSRLDDAPSRAAVESANANVQMMTAALDKAQSEYNGKKNLRQKSVVSDFELSLAESDLNVAKANLAAAKAALTSAGNDLRYTEIRSPSNGVVGRIFYRKGDLVGPSIQDGLTVVAERTGAVSVCARFDNPDGMLLSGGTGKIVYIQTFTFHRYQRVHRAVGGDFAAVAAGGALPRHCAARHLRVGELSGREC